jgi:3-oxoacyl-(acyl-carrier-protein) synthase
VSRVLITAVNTVCALGGSLEESLTTWRAGRSGLRAEGELLLGRIADLKPLNGRRYGAASNLAVHVSRQSVARAGWTPEQTRDAWIFAASSRGNVGELLGHYAARRPVRRFSASNAIHSEIAAAVSIELGILGPWQMLSSGCSSGLDALGMAWMALRSGLTKRALVVAVELPLLPELIRDFRDTHLLSTSGVNDPLSPHTSGLHLGEAGVAVTLELADQGLAEMTHYTANSEAYDSLMIPEDGARLADLLRQLPQPDLICPHATGTLNNAVAESNALRAVYAKVPPLMLMKPLTGHTLGASGLLDVALLVGSLPEVPGNLAGLTGVTDQPCGLKSNDVVIKIASGMGGHNAAVALRVC